MNIRQINEELSRILENESKFNLKSLNCPDAILDELEKVNIDKIDIMLQYDGHLNDSPLKYSDLANRELVKKVIKDIEGVDIGNNQIKLYDKPLLTLVGDMSEYSFRLYFGEIALDEDGEYIDFCLDCIPEDEKHFKIILNQWK